MNREYLRKILNTYLPEHDANDLFLKKLKMKNFYLAVTINNKNKLESYQRLEFLGDSVFHLVITDYIYHRYPKEDDGFLSKLRIQIESGNSMSFLCEDIELDKLIDSNEDITENIKEDVFEAFVGALFLELNYTNTKNLLINLIEKHKDFSQLISTVDNYKGLLMRYFHKMKWGNPKYKNTKINEIYLIKIRDIEHNILAEHKSRDKKKAEQNAAKKALIYLNVLNENNQINDDFFKEPKLTLKKNSAIIPMENPNNKILDKKILNELFIKYYIPIDKSIKFNQSLYTLAMTHKSYIKSSNIDKSIECIVYPKKKSNERIKLLGNAVIHLIITEYLFKKFEDKMEGFMTRIRSRIEAANILSEITIKTNIVNYILVSQSIDVLHGRNNVNINSGCYESFLGATYLNYNYKISNLFFINTLQEEINLNDIIENETNYKMLIQQHVYKIGGGNIKFGIVDEKGPVHKKIFYIGLLIMDELVMIGLGNSIKKAQQHACRRYYEEILNKRI